MKLANYKFFILIILLIAIGVYFPFFLSAKNKTPKIPYCNMAGLWKVDGYALDFNPKLYEGCKNFTPPEPRFLDGHALFVYMPSNFTNENINQENYENKLEFPVNKKKSEEDIKLSMLISLRRNYLTAEESLNLEINRLNLVYINSGIVGLKKLEPSDLGKESVSSYYFTENEQSPVLISCITAFKNKGQCTVQFNIFNEGEKKGLVEYRFSEIYLKYFFSIDAYVHALINSMITY